MARLRVHCSRRREEGIKRLQEANKLGIPVHRDRRHEPDPDVIDFPIPGNDDAIRSCPDHGAIGDAIEQARASCRPKRSSLEEIEASSYSTKAA